MTGMDRIDSLFGSSFGPNYIKAQEAINKLLENKQQQGETLALSDAEAQRFIKAYNITDVTLKVFIHRAQDKLLGDRLDIAILSPAIKDKAKISRLIKDTRNLGDAIKAVFKAQKGNTAISKEAAQAIAAKFTNIKGLDADLVQARAKQLASNFLKSLHEIPEEDKT